MKHNWKVDYCCEVYKYNNLKKKIFKTIKFKDCVNAQNIEREIRKNDW